VPSPTNRGIHLRLDRWRSSQRRCPVALYPNDETEDNPEPRGWDAITAVCERVYPGQKEQHYAPVPPAMLGGPDPLNGISVYRAESPVPHWHFVTYGFSELFEKESDDPEVSGYGFELTFRLARAHDEQEVPSWALNFLQNLGRYVFRTGNAFAAGHHMNLAGPINLGRPETAIRACVLILDPEFGSMDTPNGRVEFLQLVGITLDELQAIEDWNPDGVLDILREQNPRLVTDLDRQSGLADTAVVERMRAGAERDGSSTAMNFIEALRWQADGHRLTVTIGANGLSGVLRLLRGRTRHGRPFWVHSRTGRANARPAETAAWQEDDGALVLDLPPALTAELLATLLPRRGSYTFPSTPWLTVVVEPSEIRDSRGNVTEIVG
jgi:hypothetical protein